jgi:enoyl-CoA hydratase/carnithine racemase
MLSVEEALVTMGERAVAHYMKVNPVQTSLVSTQFNIAEGFAVLTLNNPKHYNELDLPLTSALTAAIENVQKYIDDDTRIKAVILAGAGKHFCVGVKHTNDSSLVMAMNDWNFARPPAAALMHWFAEAWTAIRRVSVPVLAILHGHLIGGAVAMALNTDWRVATANASFQHGNLKRGMNPVAQFSQSLPRLAGCWIPLLCHHVYCGLWSF